MKGRTKEGTKGEQIREIQGKTKGKTRGRRVKEEDKYKRKQRRMHEGKDVWMNEGDK